MHPKDLQIESLPEGISRNHLLQAIAKYDEGFVHEFADSTGYDLVYGGKAYPPKAIVGIAAEVLKGVPFGPKDFSGGIGSKCFRILEQNGFELVSKKDPNAANSDGISVPLFTEKTFTLLEGLTETPTKEFYQKNKSAISEDIQNPLKTLFKLIEKRLPVIMLSALETEKKILSNVLKNDYGKGGAYNFLWGAFFPKGDKRSHSAQLFLTLTKDSLSGGFYVGENGEDIKKRFKENCSKPEAITLAAELDRQFRGVKIAYGARKGSQLAIESSSFYNLASFEEWFHRVGDVGAGARVFFEKDEVLGLSGDKLADKLSELFIKFYPLFFFAKQEDPFPFIEAHRKGINIESKNSSAGGHKERFSQFLAVNFPIENSGTRASYIRGLDMLSKMISAVPMGFEDCVNIWHVNSTGRLTKLLETVEVQRGLGEVSPWQKLDLAPSYLRDGFTSAALRQYIDFLNKNSTTQEVQYWTWSAGEGGEHWEEYYQQGIIAIGWDEIGDLRKFRTKEEIRRRVLGVNNDTELENESSKKNDVLACWEFANEMRIGDIIFSKQGKTKIIGYGIVEGDYEFDGSRAKYKQIRKVRWLAKGEWSLPNGNGMAIKTLTNITGYKDFVNLIANLVGLPTKDSGSNVEINNPAYSVAQCAKDSGFPFEDIEKWVRAINRKGQAILYGAPGTGKTFVADRLARHLISGNKGFIDLIQFHPAYSYEDFIEGIRPTTEGGQLAYSPAAGRFLDFCKNAERRNGICVLIIDEINRANLSRVFGELMYLLEYRNKEMVLAGGTKFRIPSNIRIIGTMNTADRSIALVDHALRRRFSFIPLSPRYEVIENFHKATDFDPVELIKVLKRVNDLINDKHYHIGISFFLKNNLKAQIADIWTLEIEPYLEELFFDQQDKMDQFRWERIQSKILGSS